MTDLDLADLILQLYATDQGWDLYWPESEWGLCAALRVAGDRDIIIHRGSVTPLDWYDDATSEVSCEPADSDLGEVPAGFYSGLRAFHAATQRGVRPGAIICGHSLGAARAVIHGALLAAQGNPPIAIVALGCPRPGTAKMNALFGATAVRWYRNLSDPVPEVPVSVPVLLPWIHCGAETKLNEPAPDDDPWELLRDHHAELYRAGIASLKDIPVIA